MIKGYVKNDEDTLAMGLLGLALGAAVGEASGLTKGKNRGMKQAGAAAAGLATMLGLRAAFDPTLKAERTA